MTPEGAGKKPTSRRSRSEPSSVISVKRFAILYVLLMGAFFFLIGFVPLQRIFDINGLYTEGVVLFTSQLIELLNIPSSSEGSIITLPSVSLDVRFGCNGLEAVMIYSVAVCAFPARWRRKLAGIVAGFFVIQAINILRIATLAYAAVHVQSLFTYIHIYVAQGMMIAVSLGIFFLYVSSVTPDEKAVG